MTNNDTEAAEPERATGPATNLLFTVDVDALDAAAPSLSADPARSVALSAQQCHLFTRGAARPDPGGPIELEVAQRAVVRVFATSGSHNFDGAAALVDARHTGGARVLSRLEIFGATRPVLTPSGSDRVLPGQLAEQRFWLGRARAVRPGLGTYRFVLAIFGRDRSGGSTLLGYGHWDDELSIAFHTSPTTNQSGTEP